MQINDTWVRAEAIRGVWLLLLRGGSRTIVRLRWVLSR
jgi:hypothetical protein